MSQAVGWSHAELAAIAEARSKLERSKRVNAGVAIAGVFITIGTWQSALARSSSPTAP